MATWVSPLLSATGANEGTRTPDRLITNQLLYQLSYIGLYNKEKNGSFHPASDPKAGIGPANVERNRSPPNNRGRELIAAPDIPTVPGSGGLIAPRSGGLPEPFLGPLHLAA